MINEKEKDKISELIKTKTQKQIAELYGVSYSSIGRFLIKHKIKTESRKRLNESKLLFDINYFDDINSEKKAYWLGFIAADGCLKSNKVRITSKDIEILNKFKYDICSEHKICTLTSFDKRTKKEYTSYNISITNNLFTRKLEKYINNDKSNNFILPKIDKKYYSFFIAGMFDGDGSVGYRSGNKLRCNLISTEECLIEIQGILLKLGIKKTELYKYKNPKNLYKMHLYSGAYDFLDYIYDDNFSEIYLSRKYQIFKNYKNEKNSKDIR